MKRLLLLTLVLLAAISCKEIEPPPPPPTPETATLSISPTGDIVFTAAAPQSVEITVTTNQTIWKAVSNQAWCKVTKDGDKFTVSADPNTTATAPAAAVITVSAGATLAAAEATIKLNINATQGAASEEESLKSAITKTWVFPETSDYTSLEFGEDDTYSLLSKIAFSRAASNIYLKSGTYTIGEDEKTLTLSDFGEVKINDIDQDQMDMVITPTGGEPITVTTTKLIIVPPAIHTKRIKTVDMTDADDAILLYSYNSDGKLSKITATVPADGEEPEQMVEIPLVYEGNKIISRVDAMATIEKPGELEIIYTLNSDGLASSSTLRNTDYDFNFHKTYYTYSSSRELLSWRKFDENNKLTAYCNATWVNGNIVSTHKWQPHTCDGSSDTYDGQTHFYHDHNGDGVFNQADIDYFNTDITEYETTKYHYTTDVNKSAYTLYFHLPNVFESNDFFDGMIQMTGTLGVSSKNLMSQHAWGYDGDFTYTMDSDGYPIRADHYRQGDEDSRWYVTMTYEAN